MNKYYIMSVDSFQNSFHRIDSNNHMLYMHECSGENGISGIAEIGDCILVFIKSPAPGINIYFEVVEKAAKKLILKKKLEACNEVNIDSNYLDIKAFKEITREEFELICKNMVLGLIKIGESAEAADVVTGNYKEAFKDFILNELHLKSVRQVRDLEILSEKMYEAGVIHEKIYTISDLDVYNDAVKKIKESSLYQKLKSERKDMNPNSGLAFDQGMTNYYKFLDYLSRIKKKRVTGAENILLYGVPGSGKSHKIKTKYCSDEKFMERVVFHPDYMYSDFVGQILPRVESSEDGNDRLKYVFTPGPFTKMLKRAESDPMHFYYLVIEELNRGNAPAIFGEIFQLLDRKDDEGFPSEEIGESEYGISNYDVAKEVYGDENHPVRIPSNMYIIATMNTADQNVFTMDTAFQRRWNMKQIENSFDSSNHSKDIIAGTKINWGAFATVINDMVIDINADMASSEDKRLGVYFARKRELEASRFPEKVLKYLWDDAFKMDKTLIFNDTCKSLENVIVTYENAQTDKLEAVLRLNVYKKMLSKMLQNGQEKDDN